VPRDFCRLPSAYPRRQGRRSTISCSSSSALVFFLAFVFCNHSQQ
jgi:hypothetical protein